MTVTRTITYPQKGVAMAQWPDLDAGDTGDFVDIPRWQEKCIQIAPAMGTTTIAVQGSNDGVNWAALRGKNTLTTNDNQSLAAIAVAGIYAILENPRLIRVVASAGDTSNLVVTLFGVAWD
jgi:uncharacterized membrane protein